MNKEILDKMPEWFRILRRAIKVYQENQEHDPTCQINKNQEVLK